MIIFTGIQPSGRPHIGNIITIKNGSANVIMIADLHCYSSKKTIESSEVNKTYAFIRSILGKDVIIYRQSSFVKMHLHITWLLMSFTSFGELKSFLNTKRDMGMNLCKFNYPILMAADILLNKPNMVPVGKDQTANLEIYNKIVGRLKDRGYEDAIKFKTTDANVRDLRSPEHKMSKSSKSQSGIIYIDDDDDTIRNKIKKAFSGQAKISIKDFTNPSVILYSHILNKSPFYVLLKYQNKNWISLKNDLTEDLIRYINPFRSVYIKLMADKNLKNEMNQNENKIKDFLISNYNEIVNYFES